MVDRKEYDRQWYLKHKEITLERSKKRQLEHPEYAKQYRLNHKKELSVKRKKYYKDHREKDNENSKKWRQNNPEYINQWQINHPKYYSEYNKKYRQTLRGKATVQRRNIQRRTQEKNIINTLTSQEWLDILEKYSYKCAYCGVEFGIENMPQKDHIIPISKGGHNTKENVVPACKSCNTRKSNKRIEDFQPALAIQNIGSV